MSNPFCFSVRLLALICFAWMPGSPAYSQSLSLEEIRWAASCVPQADASLHITDFGHVWSQWNQQPCFESDEYRTVVDFLFEQNGDFSKTIDDVNIVLESTESFHLFLTMPKEEKGELDFLAFFKVEDVGEDAANVFVTFLEQAMSIRSGERGSGLEVAISNTPLFHSLNNNWIVVGTSENAVSDSFRIMNVPMQQRTKSLATRRQFRRLLNEKRSRGHSFFCYFQPGAFPSVLRVTAKKAEYYHLNELSSGGFFGSLDASISGLQIKGSVFNTFPVSGIAELWNARTPVSALPMSNLSLLEVTATAWDPDLLYASNKQIVDEVDGVGAYDAGLEATFGKSGLNPLTRMYQSNEDVTLRYIDDSGVRQFMVMKRIHDKRMMDALVDYWIKKEKNIAKLETLIDGAELYGFPIEVFKKMQKKSRARLAEDLSRSDRLRAIFEDRHPKGTLSEEEWVDGVVASTEKNEGFLVSEKWVLTGHAPDLKIQFEFMQTEGGPENQMAEIQELIDLCIKSSHFETGPYSVLFENRTLDLRRAAKDHLGYRYPSMRTLLDEVKGTNKPVGSTGRAKLASCLFCANYLHAVESSFGDRFSLFSKTPGGALQFYIGLLRKEK